jgi:putative restriction endonuclease
MPLAIAWETFQRANGVDSYAAMLRSVRRLRAGSGNVSDDRVGCVILSDTVVLPLEQYFPAPDNWKPTVVRIVGYDIAVGEGARVWDRLSALGPSRLVARSKTVSALAIQGGYTEPQLVAARRGQGAFRLMVIDAYDRRCAVTGEHTLPVLEAAHIRPFAHEAKHEIRNGILMRSNVHRLYDQGLVTVFPDLTFRVSETIDRDYSNGKIYYELDGSKIRIPKAAEKRPDEASLEWHAVNVFKP